MDAKIIAYAKGFESWRDSLTEDEKHLWRHRDLDSEFNADTSGMNDWVIDDVIKSGWWGEKDMILSYMDDLHHDINDILKTPSHLLSDFCNRLKKGMEEALDILTERLSQL